jgi:radical SAM/Cys-rich protein
MTPSFDRTKLSTLQVNLGRVCNMRCVHCHVDAGPHRKESMSPEVVDKVISCMDRFPFKTLDITGGAPELHPQFELLVREGKKRGLEVIDRCNLTILLVRGKEGLVDFLLENEVHIVASLPCYTRENVDSQRGDGTFSKSIEAIKILNQAGYGTKEGLVLDFIYNPSGASLAGDQALLEKDYKKRLGEDFGIVFNSLFALNNFPVGRWVQHLKDMGAYIHYLKLLKDAYNPETISSLMCRSLISIAYTGEIHDCDFHQMEGVPICDSQGRALNLLHDFDERSLFSTIAWRHHCFACTAGKGAGCSGALT